MNPYNEISFFDRITPQKYFPIKFQAKDSFFKTFKKNYFWGNCIATTHFLTIFFFTLWTFFKRKFNFWIEFGQRILFPWNNFEPKLLMKMIKEKFFSRKLFSNHKNYWPMYFLNHGIFFKGLQFFNVILTEEFISVKHFFLKRNFFEEIFLKKLQKKC